MFPVLEKIKTQIYILKITSHQAYDFTASMIAALKIGPMFIDIFNLQE